MDQKSLYLQRNQVPELIDSLINKLVDTMPPNPKQFLAEQLTSMVDTRYNAGDHYPDLKRHKHILAKVLSQELYAKLKDRKTSSGYSADHLIQVGVDAPSAAAGKVNPHTTYLLGCTGVLAGDEDSYEVFTELMDTIIEERHGYARSNMHRCDFNAAKVKAPVTMDERYVITCRVVIRRNIRGYRLAPTITRAERRDIERTVADAAKCLTGVLSGRYLAIAAMSPEELESTGMGRAAASLPATCVRDWPDGRGVVLNADKTFLVAFNEDDHIKMVATANGGTLRDTFERACDGVRLIEDGLRKAGKEFMMNQHHGYISCCPACIGTAMQVTVSLKTPRLSKDHKFSDFLQKWRLQDVTPPSSTGGMTELRNVDVIGRTEVDIVQAVCDAVQKVIDLEQALDSGATSIEGKY